MDKELNEDRNQLAKDMLIMQNDAIEQIKKRNQAKLKMRNDLHDDMNDREQKREEDRKKQLADDKLHEKGPPMM